MYFLPHVGKQCRSNVLVNNLALAVWIVDERFSLILWYRKIYFVPDPDLTKNSLLFAIGVKHRFRFSTNSHPTFNEFPLKLTKFKLHMDAFVWRLIAQSIRIHGH